MKSINSILVLLILLSSCNNDEPALMDSIVLDKTEITLRIDEEATLKLLNFDSSTVDMNSIKWLNSDTSVVRVDGGVLRGLSIGESEIYVDIESIETPPCKVTVKGVFDEKYDVYIAGAIGKNATYWKNGIAVDLSFNDINDANYKSEINALFITDNDIYAAGFENKFPYGFNASYWKNGIITRLSDKFSSAKDILVSESNVYVVGNEINEESSGFIVTLWADGTTIHLSEESESSVGTSIFIDNNDIYVGGYSFLNGAVIPKYWKNGQLTLLPSNSGAWVDDILMHDGDLYVVGTEFGDDPRAKYWKNGTEVYLTEQGIKSFSKTIAIDGSDVYVSGYVFIDNLNYYVPTYWKNGVEKRLSEKKIMRYDCDIECSNGDVYFLANESYGSNSQIPTYWKNGNQVNFIDWVDSVNVKDIKIFPK